jgi:predicted nucleic acid-binding protein
MSKSVIADTCVWIEYFRGEPALSGKLETLINREAVCICGIVLYELFQGLKDENEKTTIDDALKGLRYIEMCEGTWKGAGVLAKELKKTGITLPPSDIFLAQLSIENNCKIFTIDSHFKKIPGISLL